MQNRQSLYILIALAALVVYQGLFWFLGKAMVDKLVTNLSKDTNISYQSADMSITGQMNIHGVTITPVAARTHYTVDEITLKLPNIFQLFNHDVKKDLPDSLEILFSDITVNKTEEQINAPAKNPCQIYYPFGRELFHALGYHDIKGQMRVEYKLGPTQVDWKVDVYIKDGISFSSDYSFAMPVRPAGLSSLISKELGLMSFSFKMLDEGLIENRNQVCTKYLGISKEEFVSEFTAQSQLALSKFGVHFSENVWQGYRAFLQNNNPLTVIGTLKAPAYANKLHLYNPADIVNQMNLELNINNLPQPNIDIGWNPEASEMGWQWFSRQISQEPMVITPVAKTPAQTPKPKVIKPKTFLPTNFENLSGYINAEVELVTSMGKQYEGIILRVYESDLVIRRELAGGAAEFNVKREELTSVKVKR